MAAEYHCDFTMRREAVAAAGAGSNGVDYVEVLDTEAPAGSPRQQTLLVRCVRDLPDNFAAGVRVEGPPASVPVGVVWAYRADAVPNAAATPAERALFAGQRQPRSVLVVRTDTAGDFSTYTLRLSEPGNAAAPPHAFDPVLCACDVSFKAECPSELDCEPLCACAPAPRAERDIDYLAKDYASFRRLMLDRFAELLPQWTERNPADVGVALVELLAYVGDQLSYQQDAVASEAYLMTARRRVSLRRHARLLDYPMHDGSNARVWVQVIVKGDVPEMLEAGTPVTTKVPGMALRAEPSPQNLARAGVVFRTLHPLTGMSEALNDIIFYTWSDRECCLPIGTTRASLSGTFDALKKGSALIFEEVRGARSGRAEDADQLHRHAVRLARDAVTRVDPVTGAEVTDIEWSELDALPFPLCISATTETGYHADVSVAHGNVVLADHGAEVTNVPLGGPVPAPRLRRIRAETGCGTSPSEPIPARFTPHLPAGPLTQAAIVRTGPFDPVSGEVVPAAAVCDWDPTEVIPAITLVDDTGRTWHPQRDLLGSDGLAREFVVETEDDGRAVIRFGDGQHGMRPPAGTTFGARYRIGNGAEGNVGADALTHIFTSVSGITRVRNPLPARGGSDPESSNDVRRRAPYAFRTQARAVTEDDYAERAGRHRDVQRAAATFRWTGSWHTVFVAVDPLDRFRGALETLRHAVVRDLETYRLAGYDLEIDAPRYVPLEIGMHVCVKPEYFRQEVERALLGLFTAGRRADGSPGLFHADRFTFGQTLYLSQYYAAAQAVAGVASVTITRFQRRGVLDRGPLRLGRLTLGKLEIARLDNDRNFPDRGLFRLKVEGGR